MYILFEEHQYESSRVEKVLRDIYVLQDVDKKVSVQYVGYFYNPHLHDCVFILPKVLLKDEEITINGKKTKIDVIATVPRKENNEFVLPEDIITPDDQEKNLDDKYRKFIYEFSVWIYRALSIYYKTNPMSQTILYRHLPQAGRGRRCKANTYLDIVLSLIRFNQENKDFVLFTIKNLHRGNNKINWTRTISQSQAIIQGKEVVYLNPVNKKRIVNYEEELFIIFFSILNYLNDEYGFRTPINIQYELIKGKQFDQYLHGMGKTRLRQIKYKYFSDKALLLWDLCYAFFENSYRIAINTNTQEYILAKNFNLVFEAMIDELIGDKDIPKGLKDQGDGKRVDHLYTYYGLTHSDDQQDQIYYVGDSKYYKSGNNLGRESIYKQYTYARNVIQWNIDLFVNNRKENWDNEKEYEDDKRKYEKIRLRDDGQDPLTEGYNVIPNFFISARVNEDRKYVAQKNIEGHPYIENGKVVRDDKGDIVPKTYMSFQFQDRLFDRDTLILSHYDVNFLYVLYLYARNKQNEKATWKAEVRQRFREEIRKVLERKYSFYPMRSKGVLLDDYMTQHFRKLNGKVFTPFQDKGIITLALHTPNGRKQLTAEQSGLLEMLRKDFDIDENYSLGAKPQLPAPIVLQFFVGDNVLLGYYKNEDHLNWILNNKTYNVRAGKDRGSLDISASVCDARFLLLYGKEGYYKFSLKPNTLRVWDRADMEKSGYNNPRHDFYLVFSIDERLTEGDFATMDFDKDKLKDLLNRYGKDNANHDKGAVAVPFSDLVNCKES